MVLGAYKNGNYTVEIHDDGTRIRETGENRFVPDFPECMDVQISSYCRNGCEWCYAGCSPFGKHADLKSYKWLFDTVHPYTEMAINLNSDWPEDLSWFLSYMKERKVIVNATVSQPDFEKHFCELKRMTDEKLIWGLGVSFLHRANSFLNLAGQIPNLVVHVIEGIASEDDFTFLSNKRLNILILGYKDTGRGIAFKKEQAIAIRENERWLGENLTNIIKGFRAAAFDNLALDRLAVKNLFTDEEWNVLYSGDEGEFTFYLDLAAGTYAVNSTQKPIGNIGSKTVKEMFLDVRKISGKNM